MFIDTHAHLDFNHFDSDREAVISRAWEADVRTIIIPGIDGDSSLNALRISERYPHIWFAAGWHPHDAEKLDLSLLSRLCDHPKCVAIGEIGLDFYRDLSPRDVQEEAFREQLETALANDLPVIIHIRDAWPAARKVLERYPDIRGVLHAFSGDEDDLHWALERGFYIGLGGPVTFNNFKKTGLVAKVPIERLLVETDCPYLAPQSHRGKRNEPAYIPEIAERLAEIIGVGLDKLSETISHNASKLFDIPLPKSSHFGTAPKDFLSQNFLVDKNIARKICDLTGEKPLCVEIGAGNGELTAILSRFNRIWAIEPDWDRMEALNETAPKAVRIPRKFQDINLSALVRYENTTAVIVGNLPYSDTTPILFHLLEHRKSFSKAVLMVQKEFAERLVSSPGSREYGIPSVFFKLFFDTKLQFIVSPNCFKPVPKVESAVIVLEPLQNPPGDEVNFAILQKVVRAAFAHRRKTVLNSLKMELPKLDAETALKKTEIDPNARAETITPERFLRLAKIVMRIFSDNTGIKKH